MKLNKSLLISKEVRGDLCDMESLRRFFQVEEDVETIVMHIAIKKLWMLTLMEPKTSFNYV